MHNCPISKWVNFEFICFLHKILYAQIVGWDFQVF